ncbi:MAG: hypothetical protein ACRD7E_27280, partial [Bryobacteraceae bacterium]
VLTAAGLLVVSATGAPTFLVQSASPASDFWHEVQGSARRNIFFKKTEDFVRFPGSFQAAASRKIDWHWKDGAVQPRSLGLWDESMGLSNYSFEFSGELERSGIRWVYRAADFRNYYTAGIVITKPGLMPRAEFERYAVIDGRQHSRVRVPLPVQMHAQKSYRIKLIAAGEQFTTYINGKVVDTWTDSRLNRGGVGFFARKGDQFTVRSVSIVDRDRVLSRIISNLSLLAPLRKPY